MRNENRWVDVQHHCDTITIYHHTKNLSSLIPFAAVICFGRRNLKPFAFLLCNKEKRSSHLHFRMNAPSFSRLGMGLYGSHEVLCGLESIILKTLFGKRSFWHVLCCWFLTLAQLELQLKLRVGLNSPFYAKITGIQHYEVSSLYENITGCHGKAD